MELFSGLSTVAPRKTFQVRETQQQVIVTQNCYKLQQFCPVGIIAH